MVGNGDGPFFNVIPDVRPLPPINENADRSEESIHAISDTQYPDQTRSGFFGLSDMLDYSTLESVMHFQAWVWYTRGMTRKHDPSDVTGEA